MTKNKKKYLPEILNQNNIYDQYEKICRILDLSNPEEFLADKTPQEYLSLLRQRLESDHYLRMAELYKKYEEVKNKNLPRSIDIFLAGLISEDRLKIKQIEALPYVERKTLFGLLRKEEGVTLNIKKKKK
jgi:hypothetical protein